MAVTVEELRATLRMEMKPFMRDLQQMNGVSAKAARQVEGTWRATNKRLDSIGKNMARSLVAPMAGIGAVLGTREIAKFADEWTVAGNKIAAASVVAGRQARTLSELNEIARATRSGLSETADLYAKLLRSTAGVAKSELEVAKATEIVNKAFKAGGAAASEQAAGILQLAQGLGSGMLQGDELRSVRENAPLLAQAIADYFGTTIAGLKDLGSEGQLTSDKIFQAILAAQGRVEGAFKATNSTIAEGFTMVNNAMIEYVGTADAGYGVTKQLVGGLTILADNFEKSADIALRLAGVIAGALIGRSLLKMISTLGLTGSALKSFMGALAAARTMAGLATAFTGLSAAAGPVGLLIGGAVVSSLMLYSSATANASEGSKLFTERLKQLEEAAQSSGQAVEEAGRKSDEYAKNSLAKEVDASIVALDEAREAAVNMLSAFAQVSSMSLITEQQYAELARLRDGIEDGTVSAEEARQSLYAMANADYNFQEVADSIGPVLEQLALISLGAKQAADDLAILTGARGLIEGRSTRSAVDPFIVQRKAANEYEKEALRRASLGKSQLTLENEIAKVRNNALKEGITLTEKQIETIAKANIAGEAARSAEGKKPKKEKKERDNDYERLTKSIADRTAAMIAETEAQRQLNPLIEDYDYAIEKARATQELMNAAQKAGVEITPALRAEVARTAEQWALATAEANLLAEAQDKIRQRAEEWQDAQKDAMRGVVDDLIAGRSAAEAFAGALQKIADKLLDMAFDDLFTGMFKSGGGGGIFGAIGSIFGFREHGGPVKKGQPYIVGEKRPEVFVPDQNGTILPRVPSPPTMPPLSTMGQQTQGQSITFAPVIDARGADSEAVARLARELDKQRREFSANVLMTMRQAKATRQWRGG